MGKIKILIWRRPENVRNITDKDMVWEDVYVFPYFILFTNLWFWSYINII